MGAFATRQVICCRFRFRTLLPTKCARLLCWRKPQKAIYTRIATSKLCKLLWSC